MIREVPLRPPRQPKSRTDLLEVLHKIYKVKSGDGVFVKRIQNEILIEIERVKKEKT